MKIGFYPGILLLTVAAALVCWLIEQVPGIDFGPAIWFAIPFYLVLTVFLYNFSKVDRNTHARLFVKKFYGSTAIRLSFSIFFLLIYLVFTSPLSKAFIIAYISLYFIYTLFEIYFLVTNLRAVSNGTSEFEKASK